ncbi:ATP-binding protein [Actinoplanes sp. LDG1-06]|uniref:ATP-binding protein n=1 Tax=Paractinoplanes ovalisporus TaxID=2810368 RepID=A0ABS2AUH7_9ACTN|nr:ATP-binding protein [Actinoplanes ovalisporus]MBM2623395.1 ATP-binding protein [Actinoplanes ovalisporus]
MNNSPAATARDWVSARSWDRFVGIPESAVLDVKSGVYQLDDPAGTGELIKDVAAFANSRGGLLLVGFGTRADGGREIIDEVKPVPARLVDVDRYRKLIRDRVRPHVRDLTVDFHPVDDERGVLVIDIPAQPETAKPFVVPGPDGRKTPTTVGVPIRDADATVWLTHDGLQRLLSTGWNTEGGPRADIIDAVKKAVAAAVPAPAPAPPLPAPTHPEVGEGAGRQRQQFTTAYAAAGGQTALGHPTQPVTAVGPGLIQPLASRNGAPGPVLTVMPDRAGAVVPSEIWEDLCETGDTADPQVSISNVGLPSAPAGTPLVIRADARTVELEGGRFGPGRLAQVSPGGRLLWRPHTRRDFETHHNNFATGELTELYLRAVLDVAWQKWTYGPQSLPVEARHRHRDLLAQSGLAAHMSRLVQRHTTAVETPTWSLATGSDSNHSAISSHVRAQITEPDGRSAVTANSVLQTGNWRSPSSVLATVDLGLNLRHLPKTPGPDDAQPTRYRLPIVDLVDALVTLWEAIIALPEPLEPDFIRLPYAAPPFVVFYIHAGAAAPADGDGAVARQLNLADVFDFAALGDGPHNVSRTQTALRIVGPFDPDHAARQRLVADSLTDLALGWGFLAADVNGLLAKKCGSPD